MTAPRVEPIDRRRRRKNGKAKTSSMGKKDKDRRMAALLRRYGSQCWICEGAFVFEENHPKAPSFDHIVPRRLGGGDDLKNLRLAHRLCNDRRSNPPLGRRRTKEDG